LRLSAGPPEVEDFHTLYIVTQLYECDLERIISSPQRLTDQHCQYFVYQLLRGLKFIHSANVLHRDLKPSNLLVNSNCDLCICDFGLARGVGDESTGKLTEYVVTRWYRAPELLCEADTYGTAVDVWSVGCIFAEILGRKPLFRGSSTSDQLRLVIEKLGSPTEDELTLIHGEDVLKQIRSMPFRAKVVCLSAVVL
jgi:serine/threonine protein kinase